MRRAILGVILSAAFVAVATPSLSQAPNLREAQTAYALLSWEQRYDTAEGLKATGHFVGISDGSMGPRLLEAVKRFQTENGLIQDGIVTPALASFISSKSQPILVAWGMRLVMHPTAGAWLSVPAGYASIQTQTRRGLAFEHPDKLLSVDFAFYPSEEIPLHALYKRLGTPGTNRQVGYKILRDKFFVVAGKAGDRGFYSRYETTASGSVGFTLSWQDSAFHGERLSTVMSNRLITREVVASLKAQISAQQPPTSPPTALPSQPPQVVVTAPPEQTTVPKQEPKPAQILTGSGFFVSADGDLLTNSHVVAGCSEALILDQGAARVVARDSRNDLALLRLKAVSPERKPVPIKFRTGAVQLGESTFVLGYPLAGRLDNGLNFTNGMVSAVSGIDNDTSNFQMTAPIQPGNSGGPIVDRSGSLIGVVVATLRQSEVSRFANQNVNFGIKADTAATFLRSNNVEPIIAQATTPIEPTAIAAEGRKQTLQVVCFPN